MRIPRHNDDLNDYIEVLAEKFVQAQKLSKTDQEVVPRAMDMLTPDENKFVDLEIGKCLNDRRYFLENYYCIRDERGRLRTLYPYWSHQEIIAEAIEEEFELKGCCRLIILKPRQAGSTTFNAAIIYHATVFVPNTYSLVMGQDDRVSDEIYQRMMDAHANMPFWLKPEQLSKQQGRQVIFQRTDEHMREIDPGLGSTLHVSNAQRSTGVAIGRTVRNILASEMSRWPDTQVWTADIKPSLNAPDMLGIVESTAYGGSGLYYNMWRAAEMGRSVWRALFIPVYKVRKYFLPVYKSDNLILTEEEKALRLSVKEQENFTIPLGFFKWRRSEVQEAINATGSDETHKESYPLNAEQAFIFSGFCAFPQKCLDEQKINHCRPPLEMGEIEYVGPDQPPILKLHKPLKDDLLDNTRYFNRLSVWEYPDDNEAVEYYLGADVSNGDGQDYSDVAIYRIGYGPEPHVQVAEWHGLINPSHLARVIAALGYWYHQCEVAVEYAQAGITTGDELRWVLDYPNIYRWKYMDKVSNVNTQHIHWLTTSKTREDAINRMGEALLDKTIIIRNNHTIKEMRKFGRYEGEIKASGIDSPDDAVMANLIAICALHQSGKRQEWSDSHLGGEGGKHAHLLPKTPHVWAVYDQWGRQVSSEQYQDETQAKQFIIQAEKKYNRKLSTVWRVVPIMVSKVNTIWSPIFSSDGAEHELATIHGFDGRDQMIHPDVVSGYRKLIQNEARFGPSIYDEMDDD